MSTQRSRTEKYATGWSNRKAKFPGKNKPRRCTQKSNTQNGQMKNLNPSSFIMQLVELIMFYNFKQSSDIRSRRIQMANYFSNLLEGKLTQNFGTLFRVIKHAKLNKVNTSPKDFIISLNGRKNIIPYFCFIIINHFCSV